ncbi:Aste57867_17954 [Aphanomyces stellatus]|uniref:Aste57867_17954 protein n=1 Tax=Aphanomyces stellatus TaxID=120398 RepID=A0A485L9H4_9STRA|nr:hypothetical protein As57867_017892 [Aphanomyces stellatus]VFT94694.1 Aste57867_17954 [Aphanomyces stellatus]
MHQGAFVRLSFALACLLHLVWSQSASITLQSNLAGASTFASFAILTTQSIPAGGQIKIVFPSQGFVVTTDALSNVVGFPTNCGVVTSGLTVSLSVCLTPVPASTFWFWLNNIQLLGAQTTGLASIQTFDASGTVLETIPSSPGTIGTNVQLVATLTGSNVGGATQPMTLSITTVVVLPPQSYVTVLFPARFLISSAASLLSTTGFGATTTSFVSQPSSNTVSLYLGGTALAAGTVSFTFSGITNPGTSCNQFTLPACLTPWESYQVKAMSPDNRIYQFKIVSGTPIVMTMLAYAYVQLLNPTQSTSTPAIVKLFGVASIPIGGTIVITFPTGFTINPSSAVTLTNGINAASTVAISGLVVTVTVATAAVTMSTGVSLTIADVTTSTLPYGAYTVTTTDALGSTLETMTWTQPPHSVTLRSVIAGAATLADIYLAQIAIPAGGQLQVVFPTGYYVTTTAVTSVIGFGTPPVVSHTTSMAILTLTSAITPSGTSSFTLNGIQNAGVPAAGTVGAGFTIQTFDAVGTAIEIFSVAPATLTATTAAFTASAAVNTTAGATEPLVVTLTPTVTLPPGSTITMIFPTQFTIASTTTVATTGFGPTTTTITPNPSSVTLTLAVLPLAPGTYTITLFGITNPGTSCTQFYDDACTSAYGSYTLALGDGGVGVYQQATLPGTAMIMSNLRFARVRTLAVTATTVTSAYVLFNIMTPIPVHGRIVVTFPAGFVLNPAGTVTFNSGIDATSTAVITTSTVTVTILNTPVAIQNGVQFTLSGVTTPSLYTVGSYVIRTTDALGATLETATNIGGVGCTYLNDCSGHGDCTLLGNFCRCYPGFGADADIAEYKAPDCSLRVCPSDFAWADVPTSSTTAHTTLLECSGAGLCNRTTGLCQCFPGYGGSACNQMTCPHDCSGHGVCMSLAQMAASPTALPLSALTTYSLWDANRIFGCVCDSSWPVGLGAGQTNVAEWFGADCSLRHCASGDDPVTPQDETDCAGVMAPGGVGVGGAGNKCFVECSNRGVCYFQTGTCHCHTGFDGTACSRQNVLFQEKTLSPVEIALAGY